MLLDSEIDVPLGTEGYHLYPVGTAAIGCDTWYFWLKGSAERKKYWLVNYWKVQRKPMGKVPKNWKTMQDEVTETCLKTSWLNWKIREAWKNYKHQENHWTQKVAMKSNDKRDHITKEKPRKNLVVYFKEVVTRLSFTTFQRNWGTWTFLLPFSFVLKKQSKAQAASIMLKNIKPTQYERTKASRNGEEISECLWRSDLASRMGVWS